MHLEAMDEICDDRGDISAKAKGLYTTFSDGTTVLAILMALSVFEPLEDSGSQATEHHSSVQDHFCKEYFKVIDMALQQLRDQFHQPGIIKYMKITIIIIIMLAYFYCAAYTQVNVNESSTLCDRRSHSPCTVRGIDGG